MINPELNRYRRRLPHLRILGAYYFITFRLREGRLNIKERRIVKEHIRSGNNKFYKLIAVQVMPNHVHLILSPNGEIKLERIVKGIKGVTARKVNLYRKRKGSLWEGEYYDCILRTPDELDEKLKYIYENPVRAGICDDGAKYDGWYFGGL